MITFIKTDSSNNHFQLLIKELDKDLAIRDGDEHAFYAQFNKVNMIKQVIVAYEGAIPVACGAIKSFSDDTMEVKRMWVEPNYRGQGIASLLLKELESWTKELNCNRCILETGNKQLEALALYHKNGYHIIENFGPYVGVANSVCFEKQLL
jgi:GNAT superfamily N-acetyltransferase